MNSRVGLRLRSIVLVCAVVLTGGVLSVADSTAPPAARAAEGPSAEGNYVALARPVRVFNQQVKSDSSVDFTATGVSGVPRVGTTGLVLGVTVLNYTGTTDIQIIPHPITQNSAWEGEVWAVAAEQGRNHPVMSTVTVPVDETLTTNQLRVSEQGDVVNYPVSTATVYVDVIGYYTRNAVAGSGGFVAVRQQPLFDTRVDAAKTPLAANSNMTVQVTGLSSVPAGATSVYLNLTATSIAANGAVVAVPGGADPTGVLPSMRFWTGGGAVSNLVVARLSADGKVLLRNSSGGTVHLFGNVLGYSTSSPETGADWRSTSSWQRGGWIPANSKTTLAVRDVIMTQLPAIGTGGVFANIQVMTNEPSSGYLRIYPTGQAANTASAVYYGPDSTSLNNRRSGLIIAPGSDGNAILENVGSKDVYIRFRVQAWFEGPTDYAPVPDIAAGVAGETVSVARTTGGPCYGYVDKAQHNVRVGCSSSSVSNVTWGIVSATGHDFRGPLTMAAKPGGGFMVSALHVPDGEVWFWDLPHATFQDEPNKYTHVRSFRHFRQPLASATLPNGSPWGFTVDVRGQLWGADLSFTAPKLPAWKPLDMVPGLSLRDLSATSTPGGVRVTGTTPSGDVLSGTFASPTSTSVGLKSLGATGAIGRPAVGVSKSGATPVAVAHTDGTVWSTNLDATGTVVGGWLKVNNVFLPAGAEPVTVDAVGSPTLAYDPKTGLNGVLFRSNIGAGGLYIVWESAPDSGRFDTSPVGYLDTGSTGVESDVTAWDYRTLPQPSSPAWAVAYLDSESGRNLKPDPTVYFE